MKICLLAKKGRFIAPSEPLTSRSATADNYFFAGCSSPFILLCITEDCKHSVFLNAN